MGAGEEQGGLFGWEFLRTCVQVIITKRRNNPEGRAPQGIQIRDFNPFISGFPAYLISSIWCEIRLSRWSSTAIYTPLAFLPASHLTSCHPAVI